MTVKRERSRGPTVLMASHDVSGRRPQATAFIRQMTFCLGGWACKEV